MLGARFWNWDRRIINILLLLLKYFKKRNVASVFESESRKIPDVLGEIILDVRIEVLERAKRVT